MGVWHTSILDFLLDQYFHKLERKPARLKDIQEGYCQLFDLATRTGCADSDDKAHILGKQL